MDVSFSRVLNAVFLAVVLIGCQSSLRASENHGQEAPGAARAAPQSSDRAPGEPGGAPRDYSTERAMGARCPDGDSQATVMTWPIRGACNGPGPAHLMKVIKALEPSIRWSDESLRALRALRQSYIAVPGFGERPDFFMVLDSVWIRSFEGPGEDATIYVVQAPFCPSPPSGNAASTEGTGCSASSALNAYRVGPNGTVVDVTADTLPLRPRLTLAERRRYGPIMASSLIEATDDDLELHTERLQYVPTMRWALSSFDPETPLPESDPRYQGSLGQAHFGFVVWDGKRFEFRDRVPRSIWPSLEFEEVWRSSVETGSILFDRYVDENAN